MGRGAIFFSCNQQRKEKKGRKRRKKRREEREKKRRRESSTTPRTNSMCLRSVAPLAHMHAHSRVHAMRPRSHTTIYAKHSKQLITSDRRYCYLSLVLPVSRSNSTPPLLLFRRFNRFPLCRYSRRRCRRRLPLWWRYCRRRRRRSTFCRNARSPLALRVGHSRVESTPCANDCSSRTLGLARCLRL